jgi:hypothetical protein
LRTAFLAYLDQAAPAHVRSSLQFFAIAAEPGPRHGIQPGCRDRTIAGFTHPKRALLDPNQSFFDRSQETTVRLVQVDLEIRLGCPRRLVDDICLAFPWSTCRAYSSNRPCLDLTSLGQ